MRSLIAFDANDLYKCQGAPRRLHNNNNIYNIIVKSNIFQIYSTTRTYVYLIQDVIPINDTHDNFSMNNKICKTRNKNHVEIIFR